MKRFFLAIPSVLASLLAATPVLTCAACWPLYTGLLSSLGVSFVDYSPYVLPLTAIMVVISLIALGWKAKQRRGYKPLVLGAVASALLMGGKFYFFNDYLFYTGAALLVGAAVWNIWPNPEKCTVCVGKK